MDHLKVIGAVLASFMLAGTLWWFGNRSPPRSLEGEKEVGKNRVKHPEVPASIKLRHERILRTKPKKREEPPPREVCITVCSQPNFACKESSSEEDVVYTHDKKNLLRRTNIFKQNQKCDYKSEQVVVRAEDQEKVGSYLTPTHCQALHKGDLSWLFFFQT